MYGVALSVADRTPIVAVLSVKRAGASLLRALCVMNKSEF